ncbi:alpha/beta hydrolase [Prevotella sp. oral taxon 317]|jgi:xylanase|uniref:alpha/beta hydrolase n=1 Tax=Prevotella sp. oral taxon 317 TaxID=652721 RepID=UPI0001C3FD3E|nr:alpha/beta hydrolase [Prevotella sp. oral taxon 317]EFC67493.1 hypothetical protein HMPREF0670_02541 [Prevotella sp. oral taxon 317 str. F0108]
MKTKRFLLAATLMLTAATSAFAQKTFTLNLWSSAPAVAGSDDKDTAKVQVFLPREKMATGRAVVICPGGGYQTLAMDSEGRDWAPFFNNMGIAAIVLKYRMPNGDKQVPISDAEEAMKLVRRNAAEWRIKPNEVGIMGASAGGHLASVLATKATGDARPDFQILLYPVITMQPGLTHRGSRERFLGKNPSKADEREYSTDQQVTRSTPRAWIALSDDDRTVMPINGVNYYAELYRHDVPASLHVFPGGRHGWGRKQTFRYNLEMELELKAWLQSF